MTKVSILPVQADGDDVSYYAVTGNKQSTGRTPGEALDSLAAQLTEEATSTLIVVQNMRPDQYFDSAQRERLATLMAQWRAAREQGQSLPADEQAELDALVEAELRAAAARSKAILNELAS